MKKISVIVPVYNGEEYIERCINSVLNQTYKNIEVIVINDGSQDDTMTVLSKYQNVPNVVIVEKENEGVSKARNIGIERATGTYIYFLDADDWIEPATFEVAIREIKDYDFLRFGHNVIVDGIVIRKENCDDVLAGVDLVYESNKEILKYLLSNQTEGHLWNYLLKVDIIKNNHPNFKEDVFYQEDVIFLLEYFLKINTGKIISLPFYNYVKNENSATNDLEKSVKNLSSISLIRKYMRSILAKSMKTEYYTILDQKILNLQLSYFLNYQSLVSKKKFCEFISAISRSNYAYYSEFLKSTFSIKWKIFIKLLKNNHGLLLYYYIKLYKTIAK